MDLNATGAYKYRMHPYDHSRSTAKQFGGSPLDYIDIHSWFDETKANTVRPAHRMLRHHVEGVSVSCEIFGLTRLNSDKIFVPVRDIGEQHLKEDCSILPCAKDWLEHMDEEIIHRFIISGLPDEDDMLAHLTRRSVNRFGGEQDRYEELHRWFLNTREWFQDRRHLLMRHHSFGIFEAEKKFGYVYPIGHSKFLPTRILAEAHIRSLFRSIPSADMIINHLSMRKWMNETANPWMI